MMLSDSVAFYQSEDGAAVAWDRACDLLLVSRDGLAFYELCVTGYDRSAALEEIHFEDPHHGMRGRLILRTTTEGDVLELDGAVLRRIVRVSAVEAVPLPVIRKPLYLLLRPDGLVIYVSTERYRSGDEHIKLFVGPADDARQVQVTAVRRLRDGGTTYIATEQGVLFWPAPKKTGSRPQWDGITLEALAVGDYEFTEATGAVRIAHRA